MHTLHKAGALAALLLALAYVAGFAVLATLLNPGDTQTWTPAQKLGFTLEHKALFQAWHLFTYVIAGIALVVLAVALHERLKARASAWMAVTTPFALIWAGLVIASGMLTSVGLDAVARLHPSDAEQALALWRTLGTVQNGLGGGIEVVGGVWVLLLSLAARSGRLLPGAVIALGLLVGVAGVLTVLPPLAELGAVVFGLSQILWFGAVGAQLWRPAPR